MEILWYLKCITKDVKNWVFGLLAGDRAVDRRAHMHEPKCGRPTGSSPLSGLARLTEQSTDKVELSTGLVRSIDRSIGNPNGQKIDRWSVDRPVD